MPHQGIFIAGTDTGVGKTRVTCWLARALTQQGLRVGTCKPVVSGAEFDSNRTFWGDTEALVKAASVPTRVDEVTPIRLKEPLAPNVAARREGKSLHLSDYQSPITRWHGRCDVLLVEGVGGLLCPITDSETVADLISWWSRPVLLVARLGLGTLNHTLLTLEAARARKIHVLGVVLNQTEPCEPSAADLTNPEEMRRLVDVPVWGPIGYQSAYDPVPTVMEEVVVSIKSSHS